MRGDQGLTTHDAEALAGWVLGRAIPVRLLEEKNRNQVFAVGEEAILKAYLQDGQAKQARKVAALRFLDGRGLPVPRLLGHGVLAGGVPWTLEARVVGEHVRPTRAEINSPDGVRLHRALGRWMPGLHALGGLACFGTWGVDGPTTLAGHVLPRARAVREQAATLAGVPPALLRQAGRELERLEPAIRAAGGLQPRLVHGDYGTSNAAVGRDAAGRWRVVGMFDFESARARRSGRGLAVDRRPRPGLAGLHRVRGRLPAARRPGCRRARAAGLLPAGALPGHAGAGPGGPTGRGLYRRSGSSGRSWTAPGCGCPAERPRPPRVRAR